MVAVVVLLIVVLALGSVIAENARGWQRMYDSVYADVVTDGYVARKAFDRVIRSATRQMYLLGDNGEWIETFHYADAGSPIVDRYNRFYVLNGMLLLEYGSWTLGAEVPRSRLRTDLICENVSSCVFKADGRSAQMVLTLDDGSRSKTVVCSAVMHNGW